MSTPARALRLGRRHGVVQRRAAAVRVNGLARWKRRRPAGGMATTLDDTLIMAPAMRCSTTQLTETWSPLPTAVRPVLEALAR